MAADGSVVVEVIVDENGVYKGIKSVKNQFNGLEKSVKRLGGLIAGAFSVAAIVRFGQASIQLASDLQEVQNVVDVAFGDMAYKAEKFASTAIEQFGMSSLAAKKTASNYMAMAKGMGVIEDAASDMAISLAGLTGDVASFYNITQEEATVKLAGVFTGESEALKSIGVVMTETNLEAFALSKGIKKSMSAMSQAEKVSLRYAFVMDSLSIAQGDFVRTQDSFANKTRVLSEKWKEMQAVFGETLIILADGLLPVLEFAVEKLTVVALYIAAFARGMRGTKEETQKAADETENLGDQSNATSKSIKKTTGAVKEFGKETGKTNKQLAQFDELMILQSGAAKSIGDNTVLGDLGGIISPNISEELSALQSFLDDDTMKNLQRFEKWVSDNKEGIKTALEIAGLAGLGLAIANVAGKIGNLLGLFKKKDRGLDRQTQKTQTETQAVTGLANEWSLAAISGLALVPVLGALQKHNEDLIPSFEGLKQGSIGLSPSLNGVSQSALGLSPALGAATNAMSVFDVQAKRSMSNISENIKSAMNNALENIKRFSTQAGPIFSEWCVVMQKNATNTANVMAQNIYNALSSAGKNFVEFVNSTSSSFSKWASNVSENIAITAKNISTSFLDGLRSAWESFKSFMAVTGQMLSGVWKEHKATIITVGAVTGLTIAGIALAPYTGGASLALPALAEGAVIPPNKEFMAVLGDQKSGTNIETPLSTMIEAFTTAMQSMGMGGGQTVVMQIDGREFGRFVNKYGVRESNRIGVSLAGVK